MRRVKNILAGCLAIALLSALSADICAAPTIGVYFRNDHMWYRPGGPYQPFDAWLYLTEANNYITAVEYALEFQSTPYGSAMVLLEIVYPPRMSITMGDPLYGHSIAYWPPLDGFSGPVMLCGYKFITLMDCASMTDYPIVVGPSSGSGKLQAAFPPDNELFPLTGMTSYVCPTHWPPELDSLQVHTPKCIKAYFNQYVYGYGGAYDDNFWIFEADTPGDSIKVAAATKLSTSGNAQFLIYLESPLEEGITYILEALACADCNGCANSQLEFVYEGGFGEMADLAVTYFVDYDLGLMDGLSFPYGCEPFEVGFRVLNAGFAPCGPFSVEIRSGEPGAPESETVVWTGPFGGLPAGGFLNGSAVLSLPKGSAYQSSLIIEVDRYDEVEEWTGANNSLGTYFYFNNPEIVSITDVPDDDGGWVEMVFRGSLYEIRYPRTGDHYDMMRLDKSSGEWMSVGVTEAVSDSFYTLALPTQVDSSGAATDYWSVFRVAYPFAGSFISCPDSGYSVDNPGPNAVFLQEQSASWDGFSVLVSWVLSEPVDDKDLAVSRSPQGAAYAPVSSNILREGDSRYCIRDEEVEPGRVYRYRVEYLGGGGALILFETAGITVPALPLTLYQNHPNPFNPSTWISYYLPEAGHVSLGIYNVSGRRVRTLADGFQPSGRHRIEWDGCDDLGAGSSSGVYFCRLRAVKAEKTIKIVLLR